MGGGSPLNSYYRHRSHPTPYPRVRRVLPAHPVHSPAGAPPAIVLLGEALQDAQEQEEGPELRAEVCVRVCCGVWTNRVGMERGGNQSGGWMEHQYVKAQITDLAPP